MALKGPGKRDSEYKSKADPIFIGHGGVKTLWSPRQSNQFLLLERYPTAGRARKEQDPKWLDSFIPRGEG